MSGIQGCTAEGFEAVREEFAALLAADPEHSAQVAAYLHGRPVVDLWGGPHLGGDALIGVFSSTKGAAYLVAALLVQDGVLSLEREVRHYWPHFAAAGKEGVTLHQLLTHQAGAIGTEAGFSLAELADDRRLAALLAPHRPYWRPGAGLFGYHTATIGALLGEVVFRATGSTLQQLYEERIRAPYGIELFLGLPRAYEERVASVLPPVPPVPPAADTLPAPDRLGGIAGNEHRPDTGPLWTWPNSRTVRAGGQASAGGVGSARGLARLYAAAVHGTADDGRPPLLTPETAAAWALPQVAGQDLVLDLYRPYGIGFMVGLPFLGAGSFGHDGAGGSMAFADPRSGLAFGYVRRRFPQPGGAGADAERLARAARACALALPAG
ncbi:serine hydrolase domain-containing protein [Streptomyces harbinensis]|uniref:serine hydrolase domain-containing protein n=1 Tax=Streptomyces harbinensis TaxID=1176198 RepID=UPI0036C15D76